MPVNTEIAYKQWMRYAWARDNGHTRFMEKADTCERFFQGDQWSSTDRMALESVQRPVLTINKILATMSNVMGEQINNRAETSFRPRAAASSATADVLNKVFKQISDANQLPWKRSDMFADGAIRSRGFLDIRIEMDDQAQGQVIYENVNPKNVIIDPDAEEYDPDKWGEVFTTKWVTADDIAVLYTPEDAELLRNRDNSAFPYGYDSIQSNRDRFGYSQFAMYSGDSDNSNVLRNVRIIERQYRKLDKQKHFLAPQTGDMRPVPIEFGRDKIAFFVEKYGFQVITKTVRRIRWTAIADNVVLHDDWSPYKHFTVVPYFPYFRYGSTVGLVENLISPQELLNKVSSQELHVVNTTANSGYKVKAGSLTNMSLEELEQNGAKTGLVIEVNGDPDKDVVKIQPNQIPTGLDRISTKAEESIKTISGISDSQMGMDRADVAAKAIQAKQKAGSTTLVKPMDNLTRTDFFIARNTLDLIQEFYTEERLMTITADPATGATTTFSVNQANQQPQTGDEPDESPYQEIINDLTMGEYDVIVTSVPARDTLEDSQFEQVQAMKEMGIQLPDSVVINASRLVDKAAIIKQMQELTAGPEAQAAQALQTRQQTADAAKAEAEAAQKNADVGLRQAKTQETMAKTGVLEQGEPDDGAGQAKMAEVQQKGVVAEHKMGLDEQLADHKMSLAEREHALQRDKTNGELDLKAQDMAQKRADARQQAVMQAAAAAQQPQTQTPA